MSFKETRDDLRDIEAIKEYPVVKKKLEDCLASNQTLDRKNDQLVKEIEGLKETVTMLKQKLAQAESELEDCKDASKREVTHAKELARENKKLKELQTSSDGKTVAEIIAATLGAQEAKIESKAAELSAEKLKIWEKGEKPTLVHQEGLVIAVRALETIKKSGLTLLSPDVVQAGIYTDLREILSREVARQVDVEFQRRVEAKSDEVAAGKLLQLQKVTWPKYIEEHVTPKARELASILQTALTSLLRDPFWVSCDKCLTENQEHRLDAIAWTEIIRNGQTGLECINPNCRDWFGRHRIKVTLVGLIEAHLDISSPPPI
jgi:predicted RNase H-like nuclease (RuvC/YqgF family)